MSILMYHNGMGYTKIIRIITERIALKQRSKIIHIIHDIHTLPILTSEEKNEQ